MSSDHYFSPSPRSDSSTRTIRARWPAATSTWSPPPAASSAPSTSTRAPGCCSTRFPRRRPRAPARPRRRVGPDRDQPRAAVTGCHGLGRRRQRTSARPRATQLRQARHLQCQRRAARRCSRRPAVRDDLVESADPRRQAGTARDARAVAPPPRRRRDGLARRGQAPRRRFAAALDRRVPSASRSSERRTPRASACSQRGAPREA